MKQYCHSGRGIPAILLVFFFGLFPALAQIPLVQEPDEAVPLSVDSNQFEWRALSARNALNAGLSGTASAIYRSLLEEEGISGVDRTDIQMDYVAALIAQGRFAQAAGVLDQVESIEDPARFYLYRACTRYGMTRERDTEVIGGLLGRVAPEALSIQDRPWYFLMKGLVADLEGKNEAAEKFFQTAKDSAVSPMQAALFSSLVLRQKLLTFPTDENLLVEVREKFEALAGQPVAFQYLREYVTILYGLGRSAEAIEVLDKELANRSSGYSLEQRSLLLLHKALILGGDSVPGWFALKELLRAGIDSEATRVALQLLGSVSGREAELIAFLSEIISRPEPHPMLAQLFYMRCQLALANQETIALAEADARILLEQFPGLSEIQNVYRLLAHAAIQRNPPRYRVAADFLLELRDQVSSPAEVAHLNRLIGDTYFLNNDFANAVDFYEAARSSESTASKENAVILRLIISQLRSDEVDAAVGILDQSDSSRRLTDEERWQAEWSISLALVGRERIDEALNRVRNLIKSDITSVPTALVLRIRWLEAHLSLQAGQREEVAEKLKLLLARLKSMPAVSIGVSESARLESELLLLKAKAHLSTGQVDEAISALNSIRDRFPEEVAAERTYFTEAAYHSSRGDFRSAQQVLMRFAEVYRNSSRVPQALFEAALHCQRQGVDHYREAIVLLDRLVQGYADSELAYMAGLKQGDLLRLMNDFAGAQLIYENLINRFPAHRLRYAAELSRSDCIAALAQGAGDQLLEAASILERLVDRPDLPVEVQIESAYKWGQILMRNQNPEEAREIYSLITGRYLLDPLNATSLNQISRYWLSRTIFSLCDLLEEESDFAEAVKLYRKLVAFNLPGRNLALARAEQMQALEPSQ